MTTKHRIWRGQRKRILVIDTTYGPTMCWSFGFLFAFMEKWKRFGSWKVIAVRRIRFDSRRVILVIDGKLQVPEVRNLGPK
jgi:hypothetical protein